MLYAILLWLLGLFLILLEFYLPGAIMGISGGLLIVISVFMFAGQTESTLAVILYLIAVISSIALLIKFVIWRIKSAKPQYSIYSDDAQNGFVASTYDKNAVGKKGIVQSDLKPGGYIKIEGKQHQAISQSGYINRGEEVLVIGGQEESLIVKPVKKGDQT